MKKLNAANISKAYHYMKKNGLRAMTDLALERLSKHDYDDDSFVPVPDEELMAQRAKASEFNTKFSVLVPAFNTPAPYFSAMIASVLSQTYPNFELIIGDAGSEEAGLKAVADSFADPRIKYIKIDENRGISENTNVILKEAVGDYVALLDHDDFYTPDALFENARVIDECEKAGTPLPGLIYSDEDKCNETGEEFYEVYRKPDFNLDLLLSNNYICHLLVMPTNDLKRHTFRCKFDGSQDYDVTLRQIRLCEETNVPIMHIGKVLYHWRCHEASTAANPESKRYAYEAGLEALKDSLAQRGWNATVSHNIHLGFYNVSYNPDIFAVREDIGAIGGKVLNKNVIVSGYMGEDGTCIFKGLKKTHSGYRNRAILKQDAPMLDIRCVKVRPELWAAFTEATGLEYKEDPQTGYFDVKSLPDDAELTEYCRIMSEKIRTMGYKLLYDPEMSAKE